MGSESVVDSIKRLREEVSVLQAKAQSLDYGSPQLDAIKEQIRAKQATIQELSTNAFINQKSVLTKFFKK